jgi:hypothetical protein
MALLAERSGAQAIQRHHSGRWHMDVLMREFIDYNYRTEVVLFHINSFFTGIRIES